MKGFSQAAVERMQDDMYDRHMAEKENYPTLDDDIPDKEDELTTEEEINIIDKEDK